MKSFIAFLAGNITGAVLIGLCYRYGFRSVLSVGVMIAIGITTIVVLIAPFCVMKENDACEKDH